MTEKGIMDTGMIPNMPPFQAIFGPDTGDMGQGPGEDTGEGAISDFMPPLPGLPGTGGGLGIDTGGGAGVGTGPSVGPAGLGGSGADAPPGTGMAGAELATAGLMSGDTGGNYSE